MKNFSGITDNLDITTKKYVDDGLTSKANLNGGNTFTGEQIMPIVQTGSDASNYFQCRKFRGEGDANTYYHALDYGYSGHNAWDFYEYGGEYNFWKNTSREATTDANNLCLQINQTGLKNKQYTYSWPNKNGTFAMTSDIDNYQKIGSVMCYDTSTTDTAGTWTVTIPNITELKEGLTVKVRLKTSYNSTTNTLNVNGLGAKTVYFRYGSKLTSHYAKESVLALTYTANAIGSGTDTSGWIVENIYDSTNTYQLRTYNTRPKTKSALYRYMICFVNKDGLLIPANNENNMPLSTTKTLTTESFNLFDSIYFYNSTTTISANGQVGTGTLYKQLGIDLRYSFNIGTTLVAPNGVYLKVTADGGQFKLATDTPVTQSLPTSDDGYFYCYLGRAYSTYQIELVPEHPIYLYKNGIIQEYSTYAKSVAENALSSISGKANLSGGNTFTGNQYVDYLGADYIYSQSTELQECNCGKLKLTDDGTGGGDAYFAAAYDSQTVTGAIDLGKEFTCELRIEGNPGTAGQVLTSQGAGKTPQWTTFTDTKNTAGSTNNESKLYLVGATSQAANPQTYSDAEVYTEAGTLNSTKVRVGTKATFQYNPTASCLELVFE